MRRIVVSQFVTVDGVMQGPGNEAGFDLAGWAFRFDRGKDGHSFKLEEVKGAGGLLLGRVTYEGFASAWPQAHDEVGFAERMNGMPKYVVSTTLRETTWNNSTVIEGDVAAEIEALKQQPGGDILVNGSGQVVSFLAERDLIDEYRLMTFPIVLGRGQQLFGDTFQPVALRLVGARPVGPDGVVILTYQPAGK